MPTIPNRQEFLPRVGLGTWKTFDAPPGPHRESLGTVLRLFLIDGPRLIDTSPMYGLAEAALGELLDAKLNAEAFLATKVWTHGREQGIRQMENSFRLLKRSRLDLIQVHNLVDWPAHVPTLKAWKAEGRLRYWGLTHYQDDAHAELEKVATATQPDFLQCNYSLGSTCAESRLLSFCQDRGIAVLANRPFGEGRHFQRLARLPLPDWLRETGMSNWTDVLLGYVIGHSAVTCVIPATANPAHLTENLAAEAHPITEPLLRKKLRGFFAGLP